MGAAKNSARNLFDILEIEDEFQREESTYRNVLIFKEREGEKIKCDIKGDIEFQNVTFKYDSRDHNLFEGLNLTISSGNKIALVGPSGCGKSTIMQLILRFYEIQEGTILLDGKNILDYDLRALRNQYAIVSQEPVLFNGTIKENVRYNT